MTNWGELDIFALEYKDNFSLSRVSHVLWVFPREVSFEVVYESYLVLG